MTAKWQLLLVPLIVLCILFALLAGAAVTVGREYPARDMSLLAQHQACALPCLLGITPGETRREVAIGLIGLIGEFPVDQTGSSFGFSIPDDQGNAITGLLLFDEAGVVQYIRLYTRRWSGLGMRLGDLMPQTPPSNVYRSCTDAFPVRLVLTYNSSPQINFASVVDRVVSPQSPVSMIAVSAQEDMFAQTVASVVSGGCHIPSAWHGFGSIWLYDRPMF
jgi:hypothetical protein